MITGELEEGASISLPKVAKKASVKSVAGTPELKHGDKGSDVHKYVVGNSIGRHHQVQKPSLKHKMSHSVVQPCLVGLECRNKPGARPIKTPCMLSTKSSW